MIVYAICALALRRRGCFAAVNANIIRPANADVRKVQLKMKYEIEFINKISDSAAHNTILIFGENAVKEIAKKCFEYGAKGWFTGIRFKRVKSENDGKAFYLTITDDEHKFLKKLAKHDGLTVKEEVQCLLSLQIREEMELEEERARGEQ
jgi:hypothetical protein